MIKSICRLKSKAVVEPSGDNYKLTVNFKCPRDVFPNVDIAPASVTVLGVNKWHEHTIFRLNDVSHLNQGQGFGVFGFKYEKK